MEKKEYYYWFDWIRFLAALICVECHLRYVLLDPVCWNDDSWYVSLLYYITNVNTQVYSFFILSGFLVGGKSIEKILNGTFNLKNYLIDRGVRIYLPFLPSFFLALVVKVCVLDNPVTLREFIGNLLPFQNILSSPLIVTFWTLSYEIWFYIFMGSFAGFWCIKNKKMIFFLCVLVSFFVLSKLSFSVFSYWLLGALAYFVPVKKNRIVLISMILIIIFLEVVHLFPLDVLPDSLGKGIPYVVILYVFTIAFSLLLKQVIQFKPLSPFTKKIENTGRRLSSFTYTLYLMHIPFIFILEKIGFIQRMTSISWKFLFYWIVSTLICLVCCCLAYLLFEKHTYKVKQFIQKKWS